jgi:outer membrane receptor protein involved in Fe transport
VVDTEEAEVDAKIRGSQRTASVYASDLITLSPALHLTLSGRYNHTRVRTTDLGRTELGLDTNLDGQGTYAKFNPAAGLTWQISPALTAFGGFSQGNRAPSPIELGCSDPANPCVLPNALQSDPPLKQVVARTLEAGLRGWVAQDLQWSASAYRTDNHDDLLFISNGHAAGYFTNVGTTRRQGLELSLSQDADAFDWRLAYSLLDATFRHGACLLSESNSSAGSSEACPGEGEIAVRPGDRMAGLPRHSLKLTANAHLRPGWTVGAQFSAYSSQRVQGNENGGQRPDGVDYFGSGHVGGYALLDLTTNVALGHGVEVFAKVANVFDRRYATGGSLAQNPSTPTASCCRRTSGATRSSPPRGPARVWLGLRWRFDAAEL